MYVCVLVAVEVIQLMENDRFDAPSPVPSLASTTGDNCKTSPKEEEKHFTLFSAENEQIQKPPPPRQPLGELMHR